MFMDINSVEEMKWMSLLGSCCQANGAVNINNHKVLEGAPEGRAPQQSSALNNSGDYLSTVNGIE